MFVRTLGLLASHAQYAESDWLATIVALAQAFDASDTKRSIRHRDSWEGGGLMFALARILHMDTLISGVYFSFKISS